ncbi:IS110 family transposase, partial [Mycolicibacterium austroafricanum]
RAWLYILWHCWHDEVAYDPTQHRALQKLINQDQPRAA